jgi:hypothetical protein
MKRSVLLYGAAPVSLRPEILSALPFAPLAVSIAPEFYGAAWGEKIAWNNDRQAPRRRNVIAAADCNALVVIDKPKYTTAIVRTFRARGRRIFWYSTKARRMIEVDTNRPLTNKATSADAEWLDAITRQIGLVTPVEEAKMEPELWNEARHMQAAKMDEYKPFDYATLRDMIRGTMRPCAVFPINGPLWYQAMRNFRWALYAVACREEADNTVPERPWNTHMDEEDLACSEEDALHPSHRNE